MTDTATQPDPRMRDETHRAIIKDDATPSFTEPTSDRGVQNDSSGDAFWQKVEAIPLEETSSAPPYETMASIEDPCRVSHEATSRTTVNDGANSGHRGGVKVGHLC